MQTALILIFIEIIVILINLHLFKGDIFNPATISSLGFLVSTLLALYCSNVWNFVISESTVLVISLGLFSMTVGEAVSRKIRIRINKGTTNYMNNGSIYGIKTIYLNPSVRIALVVIIVLCTMLYGLESYRVGLLNGGSTLNAFAYMKSAYFNEGLDKMNFFIRQGFKVVMAGAYISAFMFANNFLVLKESFLKNSSYMICMVCGFAITIFSASRTEMLRIALAVLLDFALLWKMNHERTRKQNKKSTRIVLKKMAPIFIVVLVIAFAARAVVKTSGGVSNATSIVYYLAYYIGSPIAVLNTKISMAFSNSTLLLGSSKAVPEFVYLGRLSYGGNVATICWASLYDKGLLYMMFRIFVLYLIGGYCYKIISNYSVNSARNNIKIILFSFIYYIYAMSYYSDIFSPKNIPSNLFTICVLVLAYEVLTDIMVNQCRKVTESKEKY